MKIILSAFILILSLNCFAQSDTIVVNLNVKAYVVETIASTLAQPSNINSFNAFVKYLNNYRDGSTPSGNANVNIDTVYTDVLISIYDGLRNNIYTQGAFDDFHSDITSKRNTNARLDTGCDAIDAVFLLRVAAIAADGRKLLIGK